MKQYRRVEEVSDDEIVQGIYADMLNDGDICDSGLDEPALHIRGWELGGALNPKP